MEHQRIAVSGDMIKSKGKQFCLDLNIERESLPTFSNGWLTRFKKRHSFKCQKLHGESGSAPKIDFETMEFIQNKLSKFGLKDIYNMDESGLFYNMAPSKTISRRQIEGSKKDKTRVSIAFTTNADGSDKLKPLIIGHSEKSRCFKNKLLKIWTLNIVQIKKHG